MKSLIGTNSTFPYLI